MRTNKNGHGAYILGVEAMFAKVTSQYEEIGQEFIAAAMEVLVETTPGPDLQAAQTEYIATGRLRAGWHFGTQAPLTVTGVDGGPYDTSRGGAQTIGRLRAQIFETRLQRITFLWNEVGYGYYVHYGLENHVEIGPRPWVYDAHKEGEEFLAIAMARAGRTA